MEFLTAGFYRELAHGDPDGPSLDDALVDPLPVEQRAAVAGYLRSGYVVSAAAGRVDDVLDPTRTQVSACDIRTDGRWIWPEDLAYYVQTYGARPPAGLVARTAEGEPHQLSQRERAAALAWVTGPDDDLGEAPIIPAPGPR